MENYLNAEIEIVELEKTDVITTSGNGPLSGEDGTPDYDLDGWT